MEWLLVLSGAKNKESLAYASGSRLYQQNHRIDQANKLPKEHKMPKLVEYEESTGVVREVYDDIRATRKTDFINNFWKALANHPPTLQRTWSMLKEIMAGPGEIDPVMRELIYIAVSVTNGCDYCVASHKAAATAKGMTPNMYGELLAIVGAANMTNRLVQGYQIPVDERFKDQE